MIDEELARIRRKKLEELMRRQEEVRKPKRKTIIEVFTSPSCPHCPRAVIMAKQLAKEMPDIEVIETSTATPQGYARAISLNINAVPTIFINGKLAFVGAPSMEALKRAVRNQRVYAPQDT